MRTTKEHTLEPIQRSTWLLTSHRVGDNNQVLALAEMLGWPFESKRLHYRSNRLLTKLISKQLLGITLAGVDQRRSCPLKPPWPDLVISAGRDNEPVARWIRKMSGGQTRLVHMGRPWGPISAFDLVVTTPQYFLPKRPNILENQLPLHRVTRERLLAAAAQWQPRLAHLPRPYTVVLVGGNSGPLRLTRKKARELGRLANRLAGSVGGSILVTDSARTPPRAYDTMCREFTRPRHIHRGADGVEENPYFGYLGLADQVIVTSESVSMLTEASVTGKPVFIYDLCAKPEDGSIDQRSVWSRLSHNLHYRAIRQWLASQFGPLRMHRDITRIQRSMVDNGRAFWLRKAPATIREFSPCEAECDAKRTAARVSALFKP